MGKYANLMWMPIINAVLTCGIIIARSIVTLDFAFGSGESDYEDNSFDDSFPDSFKWESPDVSSHHKSSANTEEFFEPTRLRVFFAVHHFSLDIIVAVIALQMAVRIYKHQQIGSRQNGTNFVSLANFCGIFAFVMFVGHIVIWKILPWVTESYLSVPRVVTRIIPVVFYISTSAYCILQSIVSHLDINRQTSPATATNDWSDGNRQSTNVTFAQRHTVYLRVFCTGAVVLLSVVSAVGMLSRMFSPVSMDTTRKILGGVVALFFLTYVPLFRTFSCASRRLTSSAGDRVTAGTTTNYPQGNYPTAQLPQGTNYPTAPLAGQTGSLPPQTLPQPPGYDELYSNQGVHERIPMTPVYVRPLGPNTGYVDDFGIDGPRDGP